MKARGVFVTGTDTDVGKTWVATRLVSGLRVAGIDAVGMKPIECGGRDDSRALLEASSDPDLTLDEVNPITLSEPIAPAAMSDSDPIDFADLRSHLNTLTNRHEFVVVEGAGGWLVPVDNERTMADLAVELDLPVLIVSANRLGVLNHTLLTVRAIEASSLSCMGVFLNRNQPEADLSSRSNAGVLRKILADLPLIDQNLEDLVRLCRKL